jgi:hypothetical protein
MNSIVVTARRHEWNTGRSGVRKSFLNCSADTKKKFPFITQSVFGYNCYQPTTNLKKGQSECNKTNPEVILALEVVSLVKKFPGFHRIRKFITMLAKTLPLVPRVSTVQSLKPHISSVWSNLILYSTEAKYLIQSSSSASGSWLKIYPLCFMSYGRYVLWPVHSPWVYLPKRPMSGKNRACVLWRSNITFIFFQTTNHVNPSKLGLQLLAYVPSSISTR